MRISQSTIDRVGPVVGWTGAIVFIPFAIIIIAGVVLSRPLVAAWAQTWSWHEEEWHPFFAWFPVRLGDGEMVFWEWVERRQWAPGEIIYREDTPNA